MPFTHKKLVTASHLLKETEVVVG